MRRFVTWAVLIAFLYCQCSPRHYSGYSRIEIPITVSDVVGEVIDAEERNQYGLFKGIENFEQARFYPIAEDGLCTEIQTTNYTLVAVQHEPQMRFILKDYIENYESIQSLNRTFETKWKIIDYDTLGFPITESEFASIRSHGCCIIGAAGFGVIAFGLMALLSLGYAWEHQYDDQGDVWNTAVLTTLSGTFAGFITGSLLGRKIDSDRAMEVIKESRMPKLVY